MEAGTSGPPVRPYSEAVATFSLDDAMSHLDGDLEQGLNACIECCDRHAKGEAIAVDCIDSKGQHRSLTFTELQTYASRVANMLVASGVKPGDVVAGLLPRTPELIATILGVWRAGAVYQPLFTAFGPKAIEHRLSMSSATLVVTNSAQRGKLDEVLDCPPIATVLPLGEQPRPSDIDFLAALESQAASFEPVLRKGTDLFMMMSTSGTTGLPKGVPVPLRALLAFGAYMREAVDLRENDRFWNVADPGWAYGLYYAITGPLLLGHATTLYEGSFTVDSTYDVIERLGINNLAGSPTAFRILMAAGADAAARVKGKLRVVSSAGEPLNPEVVRWFDSVLGARIYDHYGQTETGMVVNNHHALAHPVRPGSAGFAMPGYRVAVLDEEGAELPPNQAGRLAVDISKSPLLWFTGYLKHDPSLFAGGYYRTGDNVELEPDGSISFIGRSDDVITSSGYRIGPFDVESALIEHPAVYEAAVIGVPDAERTEIVKAFVVLRSGYHGGPELAEELTQHVKRRLSAHAYPRAIEFLDELPKTPSGKIQRFILRKMEADRANSTAARKA
ncbi:acyl-CoA synthetase [Paraburkholderia diazotrophica]|uniref:acyl-CoA synthetase n=1 Tax=Paraburkholderia diazotrophica TaxID=667676 RepID=UPI0031721177